MATVDPFDLSLADLGEPLSIVKSQSAQWRRILAIDASAFTLKYALRSFAGGAELPTQQITLSNVSGETWAVDIEPGDIATFDAGRFYWDLLVVRTSDSRTRTIETGDIYVFDTTDDRRTHAEIMIGKIESLLNNRADDDVASYSIKGRSFDKMGVDELIKWRDYYTRELSSIAQGGSSLFGRKRPNAKSLTVRFTD